jgi:hypothetical protein
MKKLMGCIVLAAVFAACGDGESGQREVEVQDNAVQQPTSDPQTNTTAYDTSTRGTQDTSTTVGWDTSARRKN